MSKTLFAEVVLDNALDRSLDYAVPGDLSSAEVGMRVEVPLQKRLAKGTITRIKSDSPFPKARPLSSLLSEKPLIDQDLFQLALWMGKYYSAPLSKVFKTLLPPSLRDEKTSHKAQSFVRPLVEKKQLAEETKTLRGKYPAQASILDLLLQNPKGLLLSELLEKANTSASPVQTLAKKNLLSLEKVQIDRSPVFSHDFFPTKPKVLTDEQQRTLASILETLKSFQTHLIHGITGSGKTEVYLQAIAETLLLGQGVLFLVPEIALTAQMIERFKGRFGAEKIAIIHHRLSAGERYDMWHKIHKGEAKIVIGARSALFSPIPNLGLIVVDEEHESTYKQTEEMPKYHARDLAVLRGKWAKCPVVLGSATPSIESYTHALKGKYHLHTLSHRPDSARLPEVTLVDMKKEFEKAGGYTLFSSPLIDGIKKRLERGEQTLLFLNRRGYNTSAQCEACAFVAECPHCCLTLTYHLGNETLACHLCDFRQRPPRSCPQCKKEGPLKFKGAGTEKVERVLHALFPSIRTLRLDADTTRHKGSHEKIFKAFRSGKADVLVGTQMIAKGLHFPQITLVGVMGIDGSLNIPDFRASEQVFQLLTQVAGRSGRGELSGEVIIQTHLPEHPLFQLAKNQDYPSFYHDEIEVRRLFGFPPFKRLIKCTFSGKNEAIVEKRAKEFRVALIKGLPKESEILPVTPCGYARIKEMYRFQFLIKTEKIFPALAPLEKTKGTFGKAGGVRLSIDVDPTSTFF